MTSVLDDLLGRLSSLPEEAQKEIIDETMNLTSDMKWVPNPGPQTDAYLSEADVILYGGQAGGGKSHFELGWCVNEARSGIIFRRELTQTDGLEKEGKAIIGDAARFNGQDREWTWPDNRTLKLGGMNKADDWISHAGRERDCFCVAAGTKVLMGDGTYKSIENVDVGEEVMTLEGPKAVERFYRMGLKECAEVMVGGVKQVQSVDHPIMTSLGWIAVADLIDKHEPILSRESCSTLELSYRSYAESVMPLSASHSYLPQAEESCPSSIHIRRDSALLSGGIQSDGESGCESFASRILRSLQLALSSFLSKLLGLNAHLFWPFVSQPLILREASNVLFWSAPSDYQENYLAYSRLCDEQLPLYSSHVTESEGVQLCLHKLADAEQPIPTHSLNDVQGEIPKYKRHESWYIHPYTKEIRLASEVYGKEVAPFNYSLCGKHEVFDLQIAEVNHYITDGGIINKNCFDEAGEFLEIQVASIIGWLRAPPGQRCRVILASNPPRTTDGLWLIKWFAPWIDEKYPDPALPGELRWAIYVTRNGEGEMTWVDGPGEYEVEEEVYTAKSYTFIPASLHDNPFRDTPEYRAQLQSLPEPLRSQLLYGKFTSGLKDAANQMIPTDWIRAAMERRKNTEKPKDVPMCAIGVDCSGGGEDPMVQAIRYDGWYDDLIKTPGKDIPMEKAGSYAAGLVLGNRRDNAKIIVDMGGGYGGPLYEHLVTNEIDALAYKGAEKSLRKSKEGGLSFTNTRSAAYWGFREALDPNQPGGSPICLPDDRRLLAGLAAVTFEVTPQGIKAEPKVKYNAEGKVIGGVKAKLGFSPDEADAVVMAWFDGPKNVTHASEWIDQSIRKRGIVKVISGGRQPLSARRRK